jgi:hypothetical protein
VSLLTPLKSKMPNLPTDKKYSRQHGLYALYGLIVGALVCWAMIAAFARTSTVLGAFGVASMVASASLLAGAFFGFIFGVPRTLQRGGEDDVGSNKTLDANSKPTYRPNTNLEQISDWLTKILVGAGLTQIGGIRQWLRDLGTSLAPGFGASDNARVFATATVVCFVLNGFLIGYLWTRLYFAGALVEADDLESLARQVKDIKQQSDLDAKALALAVRQMDPSPDSTTPTQQELNDAIKEASQNIKTQLFYQAQMTVAENWAGEPSKKAKMEKTIPIFCALIACDSDDAYHRNHLELAYVLTYQRKPDLTAAESELTNAIQIRGPKPGTVWVGYEMNRALCRIEMDDSFKEKRKSSSESRKRIVEDIEVGLTSPTHAREFISHHQPIEEWLSLNDIKLEELESQIQGA